MTNDGQICSICFAIIGIPLFVVCMSTFSRSFGDMFRSYYLKILARLSCRCCRTKLNKETKSLLLEEFKNLNHNSSDSNSLFEDDISFLVLENEFIISLKDSNNFTEPKIPIPIFIILFIIIVYIYVGLVLFKHMEKWNYLESFYFSIISMTTIGNS